MFIILINDSPMLTSLGNIRGFKNNLHLDAVADKMKKLGFSVEIKAVVYEAPEV